MRDDSIPCANFKIGESVVVKPGIQHPDIDHLDIGGWRGRIFHIDDDFDLDNPLLSIQWDHQTLKDNLNMFKNMNPPPNFDWTETHLEADEISASEPRDAENDAYATLLALMAQDPIPPFKTPTAPQSTPTEKRIPIHNFLKGYDLNDDADLEDVIEGLIYAFENRYFLTWEAVVRKEQNQPLTFHQKKALAPLVSFEDHEKIKPVHYINEQARPSEPWYDILNKVVPQMVIDRFDIEESYFVLSNEAWNDIADCISEYGKDLTLPPGIEHPLDIIPEEIRHRLWIQSCFSALYRIGFNPPSPSDEDSWVNEFIDNLARVKESLAYFRLTLEKLVALILLPPVQEQIFTQALKESLGLSSAKDELVPFLPDPQ